jgi:cytochrome b involved in lipid metabolism
MAASSVGAEASLPFMTMEEVKRECEKGRILIVIDGLVCDVTSYTVDHPGGPEVHTEHAGTDASKE